jgi:hypothetical protein
MSPLVLFSGQGWSRKSKAMKGANREKTDEKKEKEGLPLLLQREIANLGVRFQVSLDPLHHPANTTIHLVCKLGMFALVFRIFAGLGCVSH